MTEWLIFEYRSRLIQNWMIDAAGNGEEEKKLEVLKLKLKLTYSRLREELVDDNTRLKKKSESASKRASGEKLN